MIGKYRKIKAFLGHEVWLLLKAAVLSGFVLFAAESFFVFVLQGLLVAFGLSERGDVNLPSWYPTGFKFALLFFVGFGVLRALAQMSQIYLVVATNQKFVKVQRQRILEYGLRNSARLESSALVGVFTDGVSRGGVVMTYLTNFITKFTSSVLFFCIGLVLAPIEMIIGITVLMAIYFPQKYLNSIVDKSGKGLVSQWDLVSKIMNQGLKYNYFLRAHGLLGKEIQRGKDSIENYEKHYKTYALTSSLKSGGPNLLGIFVIALIMFISLGLLKTKGVDLLSFLYIFIRFVQGSGDALVSFNDVRFNYSGLKVLQDYFNKWNNMGPDLEIQDSETRYPGIIESLSFDDVTFAYDGQDPVLSSLSLMAVKGEPLIIAGKSGTGKSTILALMLGLLKPQEGSVSLHDTRGASLAPLKVNNDIAYVGPDPYLIAGSVRENLLYGNHFSSQLSEESIWEALDICQARGLVMSFEHGLEEVLNEQAQLSTGQKQRLALARALLRDPQVLVLDESTANLDQNTEHLIFQALESWLHSRVVVIVTHKKLDLEVKTQLLTLKEKVWDAQKQPLLQG